MTQVSLFLQSDIVVVALIIIALFLGVVFGYLRWGRARKWNPAAGQVTVSSAFLRGLNYLISNNHDKAIEEFTRAVKVDSETIETYVALGNLFRTKGEIERAIRIRQSIILRQGVDEDIRRQAMYDLAMDFRTGGFIDRAIETFDQLLKLDPTNLDVHVQLEQLYEETRDWSKSYQLQQKISKIRKTEDRNILAHHQTELGKIHIQDKDYKAAEECFRTAINLHKSARTPIFTWQTCFSSWMISTRPLIFSIK